MSEDFFTNISTQIWGLASVLITLGFAIWIVNFIFPIVDMISWVTRCFVRKEKIVVAVKCSSCSTNNPQKNKFCSECGKELG